MEPRPEDARIRLLELEESDSGRVVIEATTPRLWVGLVKVPQRARCSLEVPTGNPSWMEADEPIEARR